MPGARGRCDFVLPHLMSPLAHLRIPSQNVGNFMSGRNSSRVTHAPGGASSIVFGE